MIRDVQIEMTTNPMHYNVFLECSVDKGVPWGVIFLAKPEILNIIFSLGKTYSLYSYKLHSYTWGALGLPRSL